MSDCRAFQERFQRRLDRGRSLDTDRLLRRHARGCAACRNDLDAWRQISQSLEQAGAHRSPTRHRRAAGQWVAAAAVLGAVVAWYQVPQPPADRVATDSSHRAPAGPMLFQWTGTDGALGDAPWLGRWSDAVAEPLVPIGEGVRPLARGFRSALGLLIIPGDPSAPATAESSSSPAQATVPCLTRCDAYA